MRLERLQRSTDPQERWAVRGRGQKRRVVRLERHDEPHPEAPAAFEFSWRLVVKAGHRRSLPSSCVVRTRPKRSRNRLGSGRERRLSGPELRDEATAAGGRDSFGKQPSRAGKPLRLELRAARPRQHSGNPRAIRHQRTVVVTRTVSVADAKVQAARSTRQSLAPPGAIQRCSTRRARGRSLRSDSHGLAPEPSRGQEPPPRDSAAARRSSSPTRVAH